MNDKRAFMNIFKLMYPEYWVQECSKLVKFFCISDHPVTDIDWKDFFQRTFKSAFKSCFLTSGQEALASDYKLLKDPTVNCLKTVKALVAEFIDPSCALEAFF